MDVAAIEATHRRLAELRTAASVSKAGPELFLVTTHREAVRVLADSRRFSGLHADGILPTIGSFRKSGFYAIADSVERARQYARRAIDALARFPASKAKAALAEAAEFAVARAY